MTEVQLLTWAELGPEDRLRIHQRAQSDIADAMGAVAPIIDEIRTEGGTALRRWSHRLDVPGLPELTDADLVVTPEEFAAARAAVEAYDRQHTDGLGLRAAISRAIDNVITYHRAQPRDEDWEIEVRPGVWAGERTTPIESVGIYVPRGKGSFPSVAYMLAVPAYIAGCETIAVCTPPDEHGSADAACLVTAEMVAERFDREPTVYKIGGAHAIAALAFGAGPVPRVAKVLGPGNEYVTAAKRLLTGQIDTGLPAGPSESLIIADEHADVSVVAHELLVEAEHGPRSSALLLTHDRDLAEAVAARAGELVDQLPEPQRSFCREGFSTYGGVVVTASLEESLSLASEHAVEHVHLLTADPRRDMGAIRDAGEILMGEHAPIPLGNFTIGLNAVLPTGGTARSFSGVGVNSFLKRTSFAELTPEGLADLAPVAEALAGYEGFPAHRAAVVHARERAVGDG